MRVKKPSLFILVLCFGRHQCHALVKVHVGRDNRPVNSFLVRLGATFSNSQQQDAPDRNTSVGNYRKRSQRRKFDDKAKEENRMLDDDRHAWLTQASNVLLASEAGSLAKGKWHELVSMLRAWSRRSKYDAEAPLMIEQLLKRLLDERRAGNHEAKADIAMYNCLLDAWACSALFRTRVPAVASQRAREILVVLQETYELEGDDDLKPNADSFDLVFHAVCKTEGPTFARRVLAWMEYLHKVGKNSNARASRKHYIILLDAYANSKGDNAGLLAEGFIRHMKATGVEPDTWCYNIAIKAWIKARRGREAAEHADRILEEMEAPKDLVTYSTVISAWAASGMRSHAVDRAEELLREIEESPNMEPNTIVLNTVMSTWVKSRNPGAAERTEELLRRMEGSNVAPPDLISYNTHLHALSVRAQKPGYAERAGELLASLEAWSKSGQISFQPNLFSYNIVIDAWSKSQNYDAAWNAVKVLRKIIDKDGPEPNAFSFNQVITALSRSTRPGAGRLAEELLNYMEDANRLNIHRNAKPDAVTYTSVIVTLARSRDADAAERAEKLFGRMKESYAAGEINMKPTRFVYNALIDCWAKSGKGTFAARRSEVLLKEMEQKYALGDSSVAPNIVTYNAVLNAWARSGTRCCANKAEEYLERMWNLYNSGEAEIAPNDKSFNTVINAISKSQNIAKAQKALRILRRMDKLYRAGYKDARPNAVTYTSVLNSCAFPATLDQRIRRKALDTAIFTLQELQASRYGQPNEVTYGTFIQACANLLSDDDKMLRIVIENAFQQCCKDGQVGEKVLAHLRDAAPDDLYRELLAEVLDSDATVNIDDLPLEWRCNVNRSSPRARLGSQKYKAGVKSKMKLAP